MTVPAILRTTTETVLLPARALAVADARHHVADSLRRHGMDEAVVADAELVVSELMANAIRHARPLDGDTVRILWRVLPEASAGPAYAAAHSQTSQAGPARAEVEIAVVDGGAPWFPRVEEPPVDVDSGRGLGIVATLTAEWGVEGAGSTHQLVWAVLRQPHPS
jgi:anti-sigma regulatory factor (Ser/Thr protein kinase)